MGAYPLTQTNNFLPAFGGLEAISATTSSTSATLAGLEITACDTLVLYNAAAALAYARWGVGAQTATTSDMPLPPGTLQVFNKGQADTVAVILASGSGTVYAMPGQGS